MQEVITVLHPDLPPTLTFKKGNHIGWSLIDGCWVTPKINPLWCSILYHQLLTEHFHKTKVLPKLQTIYETQLVMEAKSKCKKLEKIDTLKQESMNHAKKHCQHPKMGQGDYTLETMCIRDTWLLWKKVWEKKVGKVYQNLVTIWREA